MARLGQSDYRKALDVLYAAGEVNGPVAFPGPVLETLRQLVPCDVVTFHERSSSSERLLVYSGEPLGSVTPEIRAAHRRFAHQDPLRPAAGARKLTDFSSLREYRRCELYQYCDRPLGVEFILQLYLDPGASDARLEFDRSDADFGERDRSALDLLLPHLRQLLRARPSPGRVDAAGARGDRPGRRRQDERRGRARSRDLAGDRAEASRERVREARCAYADCRCESCLRALTGGGVTLDLPLE
jgi:hypothetical protein